MNIFSILRLFLGLLALAFNGLPFAVILLPSKLKQSFIFVIVISFAIGVGNISLIMMLMSLLEISFSLKTILFLQTIICLIGYLILIYQKRYFKLLKNGSKTIKIP